MTARPQNSRQGHQRVGRIVRRQRGSLGFPTSVIRKLAPSEEWYAQSKTFGAITLHLSGPFDTDAMSVAFDALLQSHPVLAGHLGKGSDGSHQIVTDDLLHPGIGLSRVTAVPRRAPPVSNSIRASHWSI